MSAADSFSGAHRFERVRLLGAGGMGLVYEVLDRAHRSRLALKTLRHLDADTLLRFKNEFRAVQDLRHPNLVSLGELYCEAGEWFFTMELVDGVELLRWVRPYEDALPPGAVTRETLSFHRPGFDAGRVAAVAAP